MEHPENSEEYKGLTVNKGIEQPSSINPYLNLRKKPKRRQFTVGEYVEGIVKYLRASTARRIRVTVSSFPNTAEMSNM